MKNLFIIALLLVSCGKKHLEEPGGAARRINQEIGKVDTISTNYLKIVHVYNNESGLAKFLMMGVDSSLYIVEYNYKFDGSILKTVSQIDIKF